MSVKDGRGDNQSSRRIVLTGGPGGGKSTAAQFLVRECGEDIAIVPEAATMLFTTAGIPRVDDAVRLRAIQESIFRLQHNLEQVQGAVFPERVLICDRGTVDGGAYWPGGAEDYFKAMGSNFEDELSRYGAVVFFESAAVGGLDIHGNNPGRNENTAEAVALDSGIRELWQKHPRFILIPQQASFLEKMNLAISAIKELISEFKPC